METVLYVAHPSMFRNRPIVYLLEVAAIALYGIGLVFLLIWWLQTLGATLTVTDRRTVLRKGLFSKHTNEVMHCDVRNLQIDQTFFQRIFDVGAVKVSSSGQSGIEIEVEGMPRPYEVKRLIDQGRLTSAGFVK
jgi:uncharacterized membrane protein YdbT with pleckstrin-like domain